MFSSSALDDFTSDLLLMCRSASPLTIPFILNELLNTLRIFRDNERAKVGGQRDCDREKKRSDGGGGGGRAGEMTDYGPCRFDYVCVKKTPTLFFVVVVIGPDVSLSG
ncbi:hypothetical protein GWI33_006420 [Rhynchophorus ferrugineus]|uniref:Uncharacterized protein n=1 Tax=Rhynchophorus ferrugineus TaxID=354439 RepID=A0A834IG50_RHYFE|nr:hypothetical protein GWI33_006420 [Rhynchophorus ferrugineus]